MQHARWSAESTRRAAGLWQGRCSPCVILDPRPIRGLADSKQLRTAAGGLALRIRERPCMAVASASVDEIDRLNILQATMLAMHRCLKLCMWPTVVARSGGGRQLLPGCVSDTRHRQG